MKLVLTLLTSVLAPLVFCKVEQKVRDDILHATSYAEAYRKYTDAFQDKDASFLSGALHLSPQQQKDLQEKEKRKQQRFIKNLRQCNKHNKNYEEGISGYAQTVNMFTTLDDEEKKMYTGFIATNVSQSASGLGSSRRQSSRLLGSSLPRSVNWVKKGYVTKIKNQENCGACWAFGAMVPLEYAYKKITGNLISLSEQELLDCTPEGWGGPSDGCVGSWPHNAYKFVMDKQSVPTMRSHPYRNKDLPCRYKQHDSAIARKFKLTGYHNAKSVQSAMSALAKHGPLVNACFTGNDFFAYNKGIYDGCHNRQRSNHAVAMVGYDEQSWLIRNSWGDEWGLDGYMKMKRRNVCNILDYSLYITFEKVKGYVPKKDKNDESPPPPRCEDKGKESEDMHCAYWKTLGHCETKRDYMAKYCADTCELCDEELSSKVKRPRRGRRT